MRDFSELGEALRRRLFFDGVESEVAFRNSNAGVSRNATKERGRGYFSNRGFQHVIVVAARNTVQYDSGKTQLRLETFEAFNNGCDAACAVRRIENQHNRKV